MIPFNYNYGNLNSSFLNEFSKINDKDFIFFNNLNLNFKIVNRKFIKWNYNQEENINYIPEFNTFNLEYRDNNDIYDFNGKKIWMILNLELWMREFFD